MMNGVQVTRARVLSWTHGVFPLRLLRKLIDRSRNVGLHSGVAMYATSISYQNDSKASCMESTYTRRHGLRAWEGSNAVGEKGTVEGGKVLVLI